MSATLQQIASEIGVNVSTVSRVLNRPGQGGASQATRQRIEEAARRLGYQPHFGAQALRRGRSGLVSVLVPDITDPVLAHYVELLSGQLREQGLYAVPFPTGWSPEEERQALEVLPRRTVDAAIGLCYHRANAELYESLRGRGYHLVHRVVDDALESVNIDCVGIDITDAYESLAEHLFAQGYQKIAVVGGAVAEALANRDHSTLAAQSLVQAHKAHHRTWDSHRALACGTQPEAAHQAVLQAFRQDPQFCDAIIIQSGKMVLGVWRALRDLGLQIPDQVGMASITDNMICRMVEPAVTVWDQPVEKICRGLVQVLQNRMGQSEQLMKMAYMSRLVVRESTQKHGGDHPSGSGGG